MLALHTPKNSATKGLEWHIVGSRTARSDNLVSVVDSLGDETLLWHVSLIPLIYLFTFVAFPCFWWSDGLVLTMPGVEPCSVVGLDDLFLSLVTACLLCDALIWLWCNTFIHFFIVLTMLKLTKMKNIKLVINSFYKCNHIFPKNNSSWGIWFVQHE